MMSNRIELNEQETENVVGGVLRWKAGTVYPKDNPDCQYSYVDFTACQQWIIANWGKKQDESCLQALEAAGLVHKK